MSDLQKITNWLSTYSDDQRLQGLTMDYLSPDPETGNITPSGLVEVSRMTDVWGNVTAENQYVFGIYFVLTKPGADNTAASENAAWVLAFQQWVQEQSVRHLAPTFGDSPKTERMTAHNGVLYAENDNGTATYRVLLTANFKKIYEVI